MLAAETYPISEQLDRALRVFVLGRFEIEQGRRTIESEQWRSGKARSLFKILLTRRNYQLSRQEALELLWPELDQERAANNLNQAVYSLRRTLEPGLERASLSAYLKTEGARLQLNPALIGWVDLEEFKRLVRHAQVNGDLGLYEQAISCYGGDFLPEDLYEDWSVSRREAVRQDWIELLLKMGALYRKQGQAEKYQQCLHRVLESDFAHEEAAQRLMRALAEHGRREDALTLFRSFAAKLQTRLNIEPLVETRQLYQEIATGKFTGRDGGTAKANRPTPPPAPLTDAATNLLTFQPPRRTNPLAANPALLVGRTLEQTAWQAHLQPGQSGLMLVIGEAGIGKSLLAAVLAQQAEASGFTMLELSCPPAQADLPFAPLCTILEQGLSHLERPDLDECLRLCGPELAALLPGLTHLWPVRPEANRYQGLPTPETIITITTQALAWLHRRQPLALVLDDLHFLPEPALRLLRYWLSQPGLRGMPVLGLLRPGSSQPELQHLFDWAGDRAWPIYRLERWQPDELASGLSVHLGQSVSIEVVKIIEELSAGIPRLALELASAWRQENRIRLVANEWELTERQTWDGSIPPGLGAYLRRVISSLSSDAQVLLTLAALVGPDFSFEILRQIVQHRRDGAGWWIELEPTRLGQTLTQVSEGGLVAERGASYHFTYPLLAQALAASLPQCQRQCWLEVIEWARQNTASS